MKAPRFAAAVLLSALTSPSFSQTGPLTPIASSPAGPGQCVIGSDGCGLSAGSIMDPVSEAALISIGQRAVPTVPMPASRSLSDKKAPPVAAKASDDADTADLIAIGGQIINPLAGAAPYKVAAGTGFGASASGGRQATFDTHIDATGTTAVAPQKATGLSYVQSVKVEESLTGKESAFGSDPKLSAGDADFGAGGFGASSNGNH